MMKRVIVILSLCLVLITIAPGCGSGADDLKIDAEMGVSALSALADSHIKGYADSIEALALTQEVQSKQWEEMKGLLKKVEDAGTGGIVWFVLPDGSYYTVEDGPTGQSLSDRDYFPALMAGNKVIGSLVVSKATGKASMIAAVPVKTGEVVVGAIGCSIFLEELSMRLASEIQLSNDLMFWAINQAGEVALHSDTTMIMKEVEGLPEDAVFKTSPLTGWQFGLALKG